MRKGLFAVVLVAASFAGGAAANGPGLAWARAFLKAQAQSQAPARPRLAATPPRPVAGPPAPKDDQASPASDVPAAPGPALVLDAPSLDAPPPPRAKVPPRDDTAPPPDPGPPASAPEPAPPEPLDPKVLGLDARAAEAAPERSPATPPVVPAPPAPPPAPPAKADPAVAHSGGGQAPADWAGLRRRMKELGVARYWVEGEPGGPARFRCIIPTAGGRAVGQHFEAEADDDTQAAEAALRRIALWKATEQP